MKVLLNDGSEYDLGQDLQAHGLDLIGEEARQGGLKGFAEQIPGMLNPVNPGARANVVYKVKDRESGKEHKLDAVPYLASKGMEIDNAATFRLRQKELEDAQDQENIRKNEEAIKELGQLGLGERFSSVLMPYTKALYQSDKAKKAKEGGLLDKADFALREAVANGADFWSLFTGGAIGMLDDVRNRTSEGKKGAPFDVSMSTRAQGYGPDKKEDGTEESLGEHFQSMAEAFRMDPAGVAGSLAKESVRDPLTGISIASSLATDGATLPVVGPRVAGLVEKIGTQFKNAKAVAQSNRMGRVLSKVAEKIDKGGIISKTAMHTTAGAAGGAAQGLLMNYAMGEDKDALKTIIIEGAEEGAFDLALSAGGAVFRGARRFVDLAPKDKGATVNAILDEMDAKAEEMKALPPGTEQKLLPPGAEQKLLPPGSQQMLPPPPEADWIYSQTNNQGMLPPPPGQQMLPGSPRIALPPGEGVIYGNPPQGPETPDVLTTPAPRQPLFTPDVVNAPSGHADYNQELLPAPGQVAPSSVIPNSPNVTQTPVGPVSIDQELPPVMSREEMLLKRDNPQFRTMYEKRQEKVREERRALARQTLKQMSVTAEKIKKQTDAAYTKALDESMKEVDTEDEAKIKVTQEHIKRYQKAVTEITDPVTPTSWESWNMVYGQGHESIDDRRKAYEDFHVDEQKQVKAIRERANPKEEAPAEAPKTFDPSRKDAAAAAIKKRLEESSKPKPVVQPVAPVEGAVTPLVEKHGTPDAAGEVEVGTSQGMGDAPVNAAGEVIGSPKPRTRKPASEKAPKQYKPKRPIQVFDESELDSLLKDIDSALGPDTLRVGFDPTLFVKMMKVGGIVFQKGLNDFAEWSDKMRSHLGEKIGPYLQSIWEAVSKYPKNVQFDAELMSQIFEFAGIEKEGGRDPRESLLENFGDQAEVYIDAAVSALDVYPFKEATGAERQEQARDVRERGRAPNARQAGRARKDEGVQPGVRGKSGRVEPGNRLDARDTPEPTVEETGLDGGKLPKHLRTNIDLTHSQSVDLTPAKRRAVNEQAASIVERVWKDPASLTEGDREILRQYTGLGGIDASRTSTHDENDLGGVRFQHYTSYQVSRFAWRFLEALGFNTNKRGLVALEPTAGIGNFIGFAPRKIKWYANEVDKLSGQILSLLYPANTVNSISPFESWSGPKVDIVVTNVPFLKGRGPFAYLEKDPKYKDIGSLHNYIIEKSVDRLRDNGVAVIITSTGTMDAKSGAEWRKQLNQKAEVVTAIRLPEGAFKKNASYEGTVDMIVFRKRTQGEMTDVAAADRVQPEWVSTIDVDVETPYGGKGKANRSGYYEKNPDNVLGTWVYGHNAGFTQTGVALEIPGGETFESALARKFNDVMDAAKGAYEARDGAMDEPAGEYGEATGVGRPETPIGGLEVKGGKVLRKGRDGQLYPFRPEGEYAIPDEAYALLAEIMELGERLDGAIQAGQDLSFLQDEIKTRLERWKELGYKRQPKNEKGALLPGITKKQGTGELRFHDPALQTWVDQDRRYWQISKLYNSRKDGYSPYLTEQIKLAAPPKVERTGMATGRGVVDYILKKYGVFRDDVARREFEGDDFDKEMQAHQDMNWDGQRWVHDREFLVGNLWPKIDAARQAGRGKELKKLLSKLPEQKTALTVDASPQATWWSDEARTQFARDMGWIGQGQMVRREPDEEGKVRFRLQNQGSTSFVPTSSTLIHAGMSGDAFIEVVLNQDHAAKKEEYTAPDGTSISRTVIDVQATAAIRKDTKNAFALWAKGPSGAKHGALAAESFNRGFAGNAVEDYSGEKLFIEGLVKTIKGREFTAYPHQLAAVRMAMNLNGGLLAWGVGYGKTMGAIFQYAALRSAGKIKKSAFTVPGKTMYMWRDSFFEAIPGLKVKVIRGDDAATRIPDMNDAAANQYDLIIVSHEAFSKIPLKSSEKYVTEEIDKVRESLRKLEAGKASEKGKKDWKTDAAIKRIENKIDRLQNKLRSIQEETKDPRIVTLEQWDVDSIFADEAHAYKNYFDTLNEYADKQFIQTGKDSDLGNDFYYKTRYIHERNGRGGVHLLTATPAPNKPIEIYKILKLIAPWELENRGLSAMDDFVRNFLEIGDSATISLDGVAGKPREMVLGYRNLMALRDMVRSYVDVQLTPSEEVKAARPEEKHEQVYVDMSEAQQFAMAKVINLLGLKRDDMLALGYDEMSLTTEARQIAVDPARVTPSLLKEEPDFTKRAPKLGAVMDNVGKRFKEHGRLQLVFLDEFKIRDVAPILNEEGERIPWPRGLGEFSGPKGDPYFARWIKAIEDPDQRALLESRAHGLVDATDWPLKKADGSLMIPEQPSDISDIRPIFGDDGEVYVGRRVPVDDLHERMAEHAEKVLGIPREQIAVVNGEKNAKPQEKRAIEERVDRRELKLIIGNRKALGEGMNLQTEGDAIHQVDVPWNPMPIIQSNGRLIRARGEKGDKHPVTVFYYGAKGSLDAKMYEVNEQKLNWQDELWNGTQDSMSNQLNNVEDAGFNPGDMKEALQVDRAYVSGYQTFNNIVTTKRRIAAAIKVRDKVAADHARLMGKKADALQLVQNAQERIASRNAKADGKPVSHDHDLEIIDRNSALAKEIAKSIEALEEKMEPLRNAGMEMVAIEKAERMVMDVRKNKYAAMNMTDVPALGSLATDEQRGEAEYLASKRAEESTRWEAFLQSIFPDLWAQKLTHLADMVATMAIGRRKLPENLDAEAPKVREFIKKYDTNPEAGKVSARLLVGLGGTAFGLLFAPHATAYAGVALGSIYALRRIAKSRLAESAAKSIEMRLAGLQGWDVLEPLITQAYQRVRLRVGHYTETFNAAFAGLSEDERLLAEEKVRNPSLVVPRRVEAAADALRGIMSQVAQAAGFAVDLTYFPRALNWEKIQAMQTDPDLLQRNIEKLVKDEGLTPIDAAGLLLNMFDGSDQMRDADRKAAREDAIAAIRKRNPGASDAGLINAYGRMKHRFGERVSGNLRFSRRAPRLLDEMYHRDPFDVVPRYLESAWRYVTYRNVFGPGNEAINHFLDTNFPVFGTEPNPDREQAKDFLNTELYNRRFTSMFGEKAHKSMVDVARKVNQYQSWTKLLISDMSPSRNVFFAANMAAPLIGFRAMAAGTIRTLGETVKGQPFKKARIAGVITERIMRDMDESYRSARGFFGKAVEGGWTPFMVSEKFVRAFSYHGARFHGERRFREAMKGNQEALVALHRVLGNKEMARCMAAGKLTDGAADLLALDMSDEIIGNTRPLKTPYWASTPEGSMLGQFRRVAYVQTVTLFRTVYAPALKGNFGPLLRWGAMCGVSYFTLQYIMSAMRGDDEQKKQAGGVMEFINSVNAIGLYGDMAEAVERGGTAGLLKWAAGPTANTAGNVGQFGAKVLQGEDVGEEMKKLIRREAPALKRDKLYGVLPNPVAGAIAKD